MARISKIEERTLRFIKSYDYLKSNNLLPDHAELIKILGINSKSTISEILGKRQNIQPQSWERFKKHFGITESTTSGGPDISEIDVQKFVQELEERYQKGEIRLSIKEKNRIDELLNNSIDVDYRIKYIQELEEKGQNLKAQVEFLQRNIQSNLNDLQRAVRALQAQLEASVRRSAERFVKDDKGLTKKELDKISKYAEIAYRAKDGADIPAHVDKQ